jgi:hypothetical protein
LQLSQNAEIGDVPAAAQSALAESKQ